MRERAGILQGDILEVLEAMDAEKQATARAAIWEVEQQARSFAALVACVDFSVASRQSHAAGANMFMIKLNVCSGRFSCITTGLRSLGPYSQSPG